MAVDDVLSSDERERAARFHFDIHRNRYVNARRALRYVLGDRLGMDPADLRFEYAANGKPSLPGSELRFNVSHSAGYALIAVAQDRELGVDVEEIRPKDDLLALARRFFSPAEHTALEHAPAAEIAAIFYRVWTRKEAYLKACGDGLSLALDSFTVSTDADPGHGLVSSARGPAELARWHYQTIPAPPGFAAALVIESGPVELFVHIDSATAPSDRLL